MKNQNENLTFLHSTFLQKQMKLDSVAQHRLNERYKKNEKKKNWKKITNNKIEKIE